MSRYLWQTAHLPCRSMNSDLKCRGWYTGTLSSTCPKCPGQCMYTRPQVEQGCAAWSRGPSRESCRPPRSELPSASKVSGEVTRHTLISRTSSSVYSPKRTCVTSARTMGGGPHGL